MNLHPEKSIITEIAVLVVLVILCSLLGQGMSYLLLKIGGLNFGPSMINDVDTVGERQLTRFALMLGHFVSFLLASIIFLYVFHRKDFAEFLKIRRFPDWRFVLICFFFLVVSYPVVGKLSEWNMSLSLPDWMSSSSEAAQELLGSILHMQSVPELLVSVLLVGILPAIGEEVLYRGIIQNKLKALWSNDHFAILAASLLFSLNHFQFDRFLPFAFLGLVLGYSYHYSRSLWVPIVLHFFNNSAQVFIIYGMGDSFENVDFGQVPDIPGAVVYVSIFAFIGLFFLLKLHSEKAHEQRT